MSPCAPRAGSHPLLAQHYGDEIEGRVHARWDLNPNQLGDERPRCVRRQRAGFVRSKMKEWTQHQDLLKLNHQPKLTRGKLFIAPEGFHEAEH